jgi:hypothetical protein
MSDFMFVEATTDADAFFNTLPRPLLSAFAQSPRIDPAVATNRVPTRKGNNPALAEDWRINHHRTVLFSHLTPLP